ncbi:MAG: Spy/CpxP family protein refolding chaperone [Pseudomonadota bacterium]
MKKRNLFITLAGLVALASVAFMEPVSAFPPGGCADREGVAGHPGPLGGTPFAGQAKQMRRMLASLDITASQREKIWAILDEQRPKVRNHIVSLFEGRRQLMSYDIAAGGEAGLRTLANDQAKSMSEVLFLKAQTRFRIRAVLTPEQRDKLSKQVRRLRGGFPVL